LDSASRRAVWAAGATAGFAIAFQTAGKATRDAVFFSVFPPTALPVMMIGAAGASLLLALVSAWALTRYGPRRMIPAGFAASALLLLGEGWLLRRVTPAAAILLYLHYAALGAVLVSGLWSIVGERFDPRTARRQISRIGGAGTLGGVLGGLVAVRVGATLSVPVMLPFLAACHLGAAAFAVAAGRGIRAAPARAEEEPVPSQVAARVPYLRLVLSVVVLTTLGEAMLDYVFKARVTETVGEGEALLRFFAWFYTSVGLLAVGLQALASRPLLRRIGLARTVGTLPAVAGVGSAAALVTGGFATLVAARGAESLMRASFYRTGYEMLFAPLLPAEKRATKTLLDVGVTRVGDVLGAGVIRLALLVPAAAELLLLLAVVVAGVAASLVYRLQRGYALALERSLIVRARGTGATEAEDEALQSALLHTVGGVGFTVERPALVRERQERASGTVTPVPEETDDAGNALRSRDPQQIRALLARGPLPDGLVPLAIPLLAWDAVANDVAAALRRAGPGAAPLLAAALLDPDEEFTVRRRLPLALVGSPTQAVVDALVGGLSDARFEVRYRCGLALHRVLASAAGLVVTRDAVLAAALREVSVDRRVWESHRLLDEQEDEAWSPMFDDVLRERASRGLQHVFSLLALVFPPQPLRLAYRGLFAADPQVRGTALEYLETTLPQEIRRAVWPFLEDRRRQPPPRRSRDEIVRDLLASEATIALDLKRLRRPSQEGEAPPTPGRSV